MFLLGLTANAFVMTYEATRAAIKLFFALTLPGSVERKQNIEDYHRVINLSDLTQEQRVDLRDRLGAVR